MKIDIYTLAIITDIYGAFWLAKGIILHSRRQIKLESTTFWGGGNLYLIAAQIEARYYGWCGFSFLTLGFLGQILVQNYNTNISLTFLILYVLGLILIGYFFNKKAKSESNKHIPEITKNKHGKY